MSEEGKSRSSILKGLTQKYSTQQNNIDFQEEQAHGYKVRTIKNASADATLAFAIDFNTAGEVLTKNSVIEQGKKYIPVDVNFMTSSTVMDFAIDLLNKYEPKTLNIAGNGLYTMKGQYNQQEIDKLMFNFLSYVLNSPKLINKIELIRSGGQSGFDEAGIKAAVKLNIPALILAPRGWTFRDINGVDIHNEAAFKNRFKSI